MMKKTTILLLFFCMYYVENPEINACQWREKDGQSPPTQSMSHHTEQALLSEFYPKDEEAARHLDNALYDDFNPEERNDEKDEAEEKQFALFVDRLLNSLSLKDNAIEESVSSNKSQGSESPGKPSEIKDDDKESVKAQIPEKEASKEERITQQMVIDCAEVYKNLNRKPVPTVETLTSALIQHSQLHRKGWSEVNCQRIANHLINLDDIK